MNMIIAQTLRTYRERISSKYCRWNICVYDDISVCYVYRLCVSIYKGEIMMFVNLMLVLSKEQYELLIKFMKENQIGYGEIK